MKKHILLLGVALALTACGQEEKKVDKEENKHPESAEAPAEPKDEQQTKQ